LIVTLLYLLDDVTYVKHTSYSISTIRVFKYVVHHSSVVKHDML